MKRRNILLVNLGSPQDPSPRSVGKYLRQFLMDPFVIDLPFFLRWLLVNIVIVPKRKFASSRAYKKIWSEQGSPLIHNTESFASRLQTLRSDLNIRWAMRYGAPDLAESVETWIRETSEPIDVVPLYPQYAKSSTGTCWDLVYRIAKRNNALDRIRILPDFYTHPLFIRCFAEQIQTTSGAFNPDHVLFSFHGLPEHHIEELDLSGEHCLKSANCCNKVAAVNRRCYKAQCFATAKAIAQQLKLESSMYSVSFQSRLGRRPWIKPYTDVRLTELASGGTKRLVVVCPSFVADCLETLEEIQIRAKGDFNISGGEELKLVPSLNATLNWVESFSEMLDDETVSWEYADQWKQISMTRSL